MLKIFKKLKKKIEGKIVEYAQKDIDELGKILNRPKEGEIVKLGNIKIPYSFVAPKKHKNNLLVDGYTTYLLALNKGYDYITILREK